LASSSNPLVLFDMDGTLLDTRLDIARAANCARLELGLSPMSVDEVVRAVGDGVNLFVSRVTYPESHERFSEARTVFLRHYAENIIGETIPYDGIPTLLESLKLRGVPMGIVSNKPAALVHQLVAHFSWQHYFTTWLGGDSAARPKPAADPMLMALAQSGLPSHHPVIMVGDGDQDILAARSVSGRAIWCSWGFNPNPTQDYPSDRADHPDDVARLLA
jgi:2-phosphoglycolate phosphatase